MLVTQRFEKGAFSLDDTDTVSFLDPQVGRPTMPNRHRTVTLPPEPATTPSPKRMLRCRTVAESGSRRFNHIRRLAPFMVEERFGSAEDAGVATPSEALLAAVGSCLSARIYANAAAGCIRVTSLELLVEVDVGNSPLWEPPSTGPRAVGFEAIRITVHMDADASPKAIRALVAHAVLWSPVANTLHDPVHLDVAINQKA